jgi:mono/diheme cytochrome c family protein
MSTRRFVWAVLAVPACLTWAADPLPPAAKTPVDFARDIEPLLRARCALCHGSQQQMKGLRFDQKASTMSVVTPGHSADSKLIRMVAGLEGKSVMPPMGARLTAAEIGRLRAWIDQGAKWSDGGAPHWSFVKPSRPAPPAVRNASWVRNPIDNFVAAKLDAEKIEASPEAGKNTLVRRLSLDLTGLPPTPAEVEAFLNDKHPDAYARLVDRLMDSPHYGEKWARPWLDLARYADSDGYEKDLSRPWAWRYRQWVIEALNHNMPFDEFTIEQIAGDLQSNASTEQRIATGFHRNTLTNREGGTDPAQFRDEQVIDRTNTVSITWLGLTAGCAQCHNHKYDPISQKEYYQLFAFFNTAEEINIDAPMPGELGTYLAAKGDYERKRQDLLVEYKVPELMPVWEDKMRDVEARPGRFPEWDFQFQAFRILLDNAQKILHRDPARRTKQQQDALTDYFIRNYKSVAGKEFYDQAKFQELNEKLNKLNATLPPMSMAQVIQENDEPPKTYIHVRGDWLDHGAEVQPGTPAFLPPLPKGEKPTRLTLAKWIVSKDNPLTARVAVNRMWQELFGRGLVRTSEDFGMVGENPSHPELLDWLAVEFMESGWDMKHMVRLMVTSAAYRQSSKARPDMISRDPENSLIARQSRLRLPAELIRDEALAASGLLNTAVGGKSVRPPQPAGVAELSYNKSGKWPESTGPDRYRRGLYIHFQRTSPYPELMNFDAPNANLACSRRQRSNTPLQALNLLDDVVFFEAAQAMAYRLVQEAPKDFRNRLGLAYELALARKPAAQETQRLANYFDQEMSSFAKDPAAARDLFPTPVEGVPAAEAAAWVGVSRVLLNLDEFITRE